MIYTASSPDYSMDGTLGDEGEGMGLYLYDNEDRAYLCASEDGNSFTLSGQYPGRYSDDGHFDGVFYRDGDIAAYTALEKAKFYYGNGSDTWLWYNDGVNFFDDFDAQQFEKLIADMDLEMNMKVRNLSSGMMAKLKIAVTLSRKAELYLLDEPLNGIDLLARDEVVNTILTNMSDNASVVISSHLVEELERIIDKAIFMKDGQIVLMGDVEEIRQERGESVTDLYRQIYG